MLYTILSKKTSSYSTCFPLCDNRLVEAGRVELPSEKGPRKASTGLVCVWLFAWGWARRRASFGYPTVHPRPRSGRSKREPARKIGASADYRTSSAPAWRRLCRQFAPLMQRRRIRNRCWQLLCCRFLRGQRRLDLLPWLPASPSKPMRPHE